MAKASGKLRIYNTNQHVASVMTPEITRFLIRMTNSGWVIGFRPGLKRMGTPSASVASLRRAIFDIFDGTGVALVHRYYKSTALFQARLWLRTTDGTVTPIYHNRCMLCLGRTRIAGQACATGVVDLMCRQIVADELTNHL